MLSVRPEQEVGGHLSDLLFQAELTLAPGLPGSLGCESDVV